MKKYYWVWLYQVHKGVAYLETSEIAFNIQTLPNSPINKMIEAPHYLENIKIIMVEKIFPYHVKEVRTGLVFPILNITNKKSNQYSLYRKVVYPFGKVHTFVFSQDNKLIGRTVKSSKELEWYKREHCFPEKYKQELQEIINVGKINVYNKQKRVYESRINEQLDAELEQESIKQEQIKTKKLVREFRHDRKGI